MDIYRPVTVIHERRQMPMEDACAQPIGDRQKKMFPRYDPENYRLRFSENKNMTVRSKYQVQKKILNSSWAQNLGKENVIKEQRGIS